jgi:hypothetical protein
MTQDEIIEMWDKVIKYAPSEVRIAEFAKLVAEREREACALIAESMSLTDANMNKTWRTGCRDVVEAIRARGQA